MVFSLGWIIFWIGSYGKASSMHEVEISYKSITLCHCLHYPSDCDEEYPDWMVIDNGFIRTFNGSLNTIKMKNPLPGICETAADTESCKKLLHRNNVIVGGTGSQINRLDLRNKIQVHFCSGSLSPALEKLTLIELQHVHFAPESIVARNNRLTIHLHLISSDLVLPTHLYGFQSIQSSINNLPVDESSQDGTNMKCAFDIKIFEVGNVKIQSNCIRTCLVDTWISDAKEVDIDSFDIEENDTSLLSLRRIESAQVRSFAGSLLNVESVQNIHLFTQAISPSIKSVMFRDIQELVDYSSLSDHTLNRNISVINVSLWNFVENHSSYEIDLPPHKSNYRRYNPISSYRNSLYIQDTNVKLEGIKNIVCTATKYVIKNSTFSCQYPANTSLTFIGQEFELVDITYPPWITFCQENATLECRDYNPARKICPIGFLYNLSDSFLKDYGCKNNPSIYNSDIIHNLLHYFLVTGIFILILLLIMATVLICKQRILSGKWQPKRMGSTFLLQSRQGSSLNGPQVLHIPSNEQHNSFKFPRHFVGTMTSLEDDELPAVNFYSYHDLRLLKEQVQPPETDVQKLAAVQLLKIKPHLEGRSPNDMDDSEEETLNEINYRTSSSAMNHLYQD